MDKTQVLRHIFIDRGIREGMRAGRLANCSSMAREYEVTAKTILRDIDYLKNQRDAPIAYDQKRHGYYYTEENYQLPALEIRESDLFAVFIAERALQQHVNTPVYQKLVSVFRKIAKALPEKIRLDPAWVESRFAIVNPRHTTIEPDIWEKVATALKDSRTLAMCHQKAGADHGTSRKIDPYQIVSYQGEWYVAGYCHARRKVLTFALSRIREAELTDDRFFPAAEYDFERISREGFGIFSGEGEHEVRIEFSKEGAPYILERTWPPNQKIEKLADGRIILALHASHLLEVKKWVLSWGGDARVLSPRELIDEVKKDLEKMSSLYELRD